MLLSGFIENQPKTHEQYLVEIKKNTPNAVTLAAMDAAENDKDIYGPVSYTHLEPAKSFILRVTM